MLDANISLFYALILAGKDSVKMILASLLSVIFVSSLVCGFLPFLAAIFLTSKVPKSTNWILSPSIRVSFITDIKAYNDSSAVFLKVLFFQLKMQLIPFYS